MRLKLAEKNKNKVAGKNLTKIGVAADLIDNAIWMLFNGVGDLAVHAVASSGFQILKDINKKKRTEVFLKWSDRIIPGKEGLYWSHFNKAYNFLKHADRDSDEKFEGFDVTINEFVIFFAIVFLRALDGKISARMSVFSSWFVLQYPQVINDDRIKLMISNHENSMFGVKLDREQLLTAGKQAILQIET